jgi:RNA polymerase sigma factor (sigma-70 family)
VRRYCGALVDTSSADDLTQETYLKAIPALSRYRGDAPAGAWLLSIARHTCIDEIRRRTRHRDRVALTLMVDPPREDIDEKLTIDTAIRALADDRREAFVLTQVIGLSYAEAAETIGCPSAQSDPESSAPDPTSSTPCTNRPRDAAERSDFSRTAAAPPDPDRRPLSGSRAKCVWLAS